MQILDLSTNLTQLLQEYPPLKELLIALGLEEVQKDTFLQSVGKQITLLQALEMKHMDIDAVQNALQAQGWTLDAKQVETIKEQKNLHAQVDMDNRLQKMEALCQIEGHPLATFVKENQALAKRLDVLEEAIAQKQDLKEPLEQVRAGALHYAKKGDLLYPLLKVRYGITGPSDVMWTEDDLIRDVLTALSKQDLTQEPARTKLQGICIHIRQMIEKEQKILYPVCAAYLTHAEWVQIYQDAKDYGVCLGVESPIWQEGEGKQTTEATMQAQTISFAMGQLTAKQIDAMLNTIPMEITFIDDKNINCYFNEGEKVFKRPSMAIGREVFSCHPPKIEPMVRKIIEDLRTGKKNEVSVWMEKLGKPMFVNYMAVRDASGGYLGTMELVQDMTFAKEYFAKKILLKE